MTVLNIFVPLLEHQSTDNGALSSEDEKATTSDTCTDDVLSSENEEILTLDDETTTQAAIDETMIEMTGEMVEHEMAAHMEDSLSEKQQNDMQVKNEHEEPSPHLTTSFNNIQSWICMVLFRIYFKFKLPKAALLSICGLISILLHHIALPLRNILPTTLHNLYKAVRSSKMEKTVFIVCPNDVCNQLYKPNELKLNKSCSNLIFGKRCGCELGYYKHMAF